MRNRLLLSFLFTLFAMPALAAVTPNSPVTAQTPNRGVVQFLQGTDSAGTYKTLYTGGSNGSDVIGIYVTNNDASATHLVTCEVVNSTVKYGGAAFTTVESAGYANAVPAQNLMAPYNWPGLPQDSRGNPVLRLISGDTLQCTFATSLTTTDKINLVAVTADY